jgi:hypothetical protein
MDAYAERQHREAEILSVAFNDPKKLKDMFPPRRRRRIDAPKWWG